jgi:protein-disulfide isomerase
MGNNNNKNYLLPASIIVAAILISGSIIYLVGSSKNGGETAGGSETLKKETSQDVILGDPKAPVTVISYADYQCPFCHRFFSTTEQAVRENYVKAGKVKIVSRNFQFLGAESELAAQAAECAKEQGKFWIYHDSIYNAEIKDNKENNGNLNRDLFLQLAKDGGLDTGKFTSCYDSGKYADSIRQQTQDAASLGINSTPTIFVNGQIVKGALPYDQFQVIIENALKTASE